MLEAWNIIFNISLKLACSPRGARSSQRYHNVSERRSVRSMEVEWNQYTSGTKRSPGSRVGKEVCFIVPSQTSWPRRCQFEWYRCGQGIRPRTSHMATCLSCLPSTGFVSVRAGGLDNKGFKKRKKEGKRQRAGRRRIVKGIISLFRKEFR